VSLACNKFSTIAPDCNFGLTQALSATFDSLVRVFDLLFVKLFCFIETKIIAQLKRSYVVKSLNSACVAYQA